VRKTLIKCRATLQLLPDAAETVQSEIIASLLIGQITIDELNALRGFATDHRSVSIRKSYVAAVARRHGEAFVLITRDPGSEETFDVRQNVADQKVRLIARRWIRAENRADKSASMLDKKSWSDEDVTGKEIATRSQKVRTSLKQLVPFGINFRFDG
jgi:hypothetical protein